VGNQASNEELIQMAVRAAKNGQKEGAKRLFMEVYNRDKNNERAMLGLAQVANSVAEREQWLRAVLKVNPGNEVAQAAIRKLKYKHAANDNRTLLIWGGLAILLLIVVVVVLVLVLAT
jgi:thioredoxin-like negative regulator of GroEL